jgi:hypothetical protein
MIIIDFVVTGMPRNAITTIDTLKKSRNHLAVYENEK